MTAESRMAAIARGEGGWFTPAGPDSDLVLSTRVRLARNIEGTRFTTRSTERDLDTILADVRAAAARVEGLNPEETLVMSEVGVLDRDVLLERHLISGEFCDPAPWRALIPGDTDSISVMVNEEDHLRVQGLKGGLQLFSCWESVAEVDSGLSRGLDYAFREDLGYLTACPSNVGTGLRVSVLMHLPSLVLAQEIRKVIESILQIGLSVRGFYGEGSDVVGNFFQISNQITLGKSEEELLDMLEQVTREVMQYETRSREWLWSEARSQVLDKVHRALGTLQSCRMISSAEVVAAASALRLGISLDIKELPDLEALNRLVVFSQPAHVQRREGRPLSTSERRARRADMVRSLLNGGSGGNGAF